MSIVYNNFDGTNNVINFLLYSHHFLTSWQVFHTLLVCFFTGWSKNGLLSISTLKSLISANGM